MTKPKIETLLKKIAADADFENAHAGASEAAIAEFEKEFNLSFPPSYRKFLLKYDGGEFRFARMLTVKEPGATYESLRSRTGFPTLVFPDSERGQLIPMGDDYSGEFYCLDYRESKDRSGEVPIVLCLGYGEIEEVAEDFIQFVHDSFKVEKPKKAKVTIHHYAKLPYQSWIEIPDLAPFGIKMQKLDPDILDAKHDPFDTNRNEGGNMPAQPRERTVVIPLYNPDLTAEELATKSQKVHFG